MAYFGKEYKLVNQERIEELFNAAGIALPAELKQGILTFKPSVKLVKNGDQYVLSTSKPDGSWSDTKFKSGVEFDHESYGMPSKTTITVNGNVVTQVLKFTNGTLTVVREFSDNEVVVSIKSSTWDGEAKRYYKA